MSYAALPTVDFLCCLFVLKLNVVQTMCIDRLSLLVFTARSSPE